MTDANEVCPKCGSPLGEVVESKSGKKLQRCSKGVWNPDTKQSEGCTFVKWLAVEPKELDEKYEAERIVDELKVKGIIYEPKPGRVKLSTIYIKKLIRHGVGSLN